MIEFIHQGTAMVALTPDEADALRKTLSDARALAARLCTDAEVAGSGALVESFWETTAQTGQTFPALPEVYRDQGSVALPTAVYNGAVLYLEALQAAQSGGCTTVTREQAANAALMASSEGPGEQGVTEPEPHPWTKVGIAAGILGALVALVALFRR